MTRLIHVEITADDVPATAAFYASALGLESAPSPFAPNYTLLTGPEGPVGAIMQRAANGQATIAWFTVDDLDAALDSVRQNGGRQQGDITTIPGQGRVAYAADPNGTIFGLRQPE